MNIDNARLVFKAMAESPMKIDMRDWFSGRDLSVLQDKEVFECGTAACFAGHTLSALAPQARRCSYSDTSVVLPDGTTSTISNVARELLGLTYEQACVLFDSQVCLTHLDQLCGYAVDGQGCDPAAKPTIDQLKDVVAAVTDVDRIELD